MMDRIGEFPELAAIAVLLLGFVVARIASVATGRLMDALDRRVSRTSTGETGVLTPRLIRVSRAFVFWAVLILSVALSLRFLGAQGASIGLDTLVIAYVPQALIAFAIIIAGHLVGLLASGLVAGMGDPPSQNPVGPKILHGFIVAIAIVVALQQIGINIGFATRLILVLLAAVSGGLMLAFALGARRHVANLLAHRELSRLAVGETIRVGDIEGTIVELHSTAVDVATAEGIASIPASRIAEIGVLRRHEAGQNG